MITIAVNRGFKRGDIITVVQALGGPIYCKVLSVTDTSVLNIRHLRWYDYVVYYIKREWRWLRTGVWV